MRCESMRALSAARCFVSLVIAGTFAVGSAKAEKSGLLVAPRSTASQGSAQPTRAELLAELKWIRAKLGRIEQLLVEQSKRPEPTPTIEEGSKSPKQMRALVLDGLRVHHDTPVAPLANGATVPLGNGYHTFMDVPDIVKGRHYTPRNGYQGNVRFDVLEAQTVFLAVYGNDWGGGGNPSGNWQHEVVTRKQLQKQGWTQIASLRVRHSNPEYQEEPSWILFSRDCKAGESFLIRTHKYQAPVLIWGPPAR